MSWHWTWQDPVALVLAALAVLWAARAFGRSAGGGCGKCPLRHEPADAGPRRRPTG